jgi:hypothetical protein
MEPDPANEAGQRASLGRMTHQARWFIQNQQVVILKNNVQQGRHVGLTLY